MNTTVLYSSIRNMIDSYDFQLTHCMKVYAHHGVIYDMKWSEQDGYLVTASADGTAKVITQQSKEE